jgi:exodeoxyribonuclease V alpha subunit
MQIEPSEVVTRLIANFYAGAGFFGNSPHDIAGLIDEAVTHYKTIAEQSTVEDALSMLSERIILSPLREGPFGSITLNARIGNRLHARGNRHGQVLIVTENVPTLGLANGDIGLVWRNSDVFKVHFQLHGGIHTVSLASLPRHEWAYALTVHKSQGSEFGRVDLVLPDFDTPLLSRALVYTAVTRARNSLALYSQAEVLLNGLQRNSGRMSGLALLASST